jgi:hypothetical protein
MKFQTMLLVGLLVVGLGCVTIGIYSLIKAVPPPTLNQVEAKQSVSVQTPKKPDCVISYTSGSCWTCRPPAVPPCSDLFTPKPSAVISADGLSCVVVVPATAAGGVSATEKSGQQFVLHKADEFQIDVHGLVDFADDHPCVTAEGMKCWYDPYVDSPFTENVGGLEFSIGALEANRFFAGEHYSGVSDYDGVPVFRVIERLTGYLDNNSGGFTVTIRKRK